MRILIYTGKGGVGKTTIAAATAVHTAASGKRTIIMSTDQAHSLRDSFGLNETVGIQDTVASGSISICTDSAVCGNSAHIDQTLPVRAADNLDLLEINTAAESRKAWGTLQDYLKQILSSKANDGLAADEALIFPGFEELFALLKILDIYESGQYDVMVVDCAPTGETLALLKYPERLSVLADKILPMVRSMNRVFGSSISRKTSVPKPKDAVFTEFDALVKRLNKLKTILQDRRTTSLRIVTSPERIVIEEARRSYTWLQVYDFGVDAVYVNRIYPDSALEGYFDGWRQMQQESLQLVEESFPSQKIFRLEMQNDEVVGLPALQTCGALLYGEPELSSDVTSNVVGLSDSDTSKDSVDACEIFCTEQAFRIEDHNGTRWFIVHLPYAASDELDVKKEDKELILTFRNETRRFRLPDKLVRRYISSWKYENGELVIFMDYE